MKDFAGWNEVKKAIHDRAFCPLFNASEVWWCRFGINIGYEEDGKNGPYERPVLVLRKYNRELFFGLPLTTAIKDNQFHFLLNNERMRGSIILSQGRALSARRLSRRLYKVDGELFDQIISAHNELLQEKSKPQHKTGASRAAFAGFHNHYSKQNRKSQGGR